MNYRIYFTHVALNVGSALACMSNAWDCLHHGFSTEHTSEELEWLERSDVRRAFRYGLSSPVRLARKVDSVCGQEVPAASR